MNFFENLNRWEVAISGCPSASYLMFSPSMKRYPPMISSASGFHTMSCSHGESIVSNWSISTSHPVPPPAARNAISRRRPISRMVLGELWALMM